MSYLNEPVAWMALNELNGSYSTFTNDQKQRLLPHVSQCYGKWIPLYTHPVKEPTDLELLKMIGEQFTRFGFEGDYVVEDSELIEFAKAILRKAQSKPSRKCGDSYDTVCPPSICDCQGKAQEK